MSLSGTGLIDLVHELAEQLAVLRLIDGLQVRAQDLDAVFIEDAGIGQLYDQVQAGLTAQGTQHGIPDAPCR